MVNRLIGSRMHADPAGRIAVVDVISLVRAELPPCDWKHWPRRRIVAEMRAAGYQVGVGANHRMYVVGLSLNQPLHWTVVDGLVVRLA